MATIDLLKEGAIDELTVHVDDIVSEYVEQVLSTTIAAIKRLAVTVVNYGEEQLEDIDLLNSSLLDVRRKVYEEILRDGTTVVEQALSDIAPFYSQIEEPLRSDILDGYRSELMAEVDEIANSYADDVSNIRFIQPDGKRKKATDFYTAVVIGLALVLALEYRKRKGLKHSEPLSADDSKEYQRDVASRIRGAITKRGIIKSGQDWYSTSSYYQNQLTYALVGVTKSGYDRVMDAVDDDGGVIISAHMFPAPDHAPFQGKAYSMREYNDFNDALPRKFMTCNCRHIVKPVKDKEYRRARRRNGEQDDLAIRAAEEVDIVTKSNERKRLTRYDAVQYAKRCDKLAERYVLQADTYEQLFDELAVTRCRTQAREYRRVSANIMDIVSK